MTTAAPEQQTDQAPQEPPARPVPAPSPARKWSSTAGPRQTKAVTEVFKSISWHMASRRERTGVIGRVEGYNRESSVILTSPFGGVPVTEGAKERWEEVQRRRDEIATRYDYTVTRDNHLAVKADLEALDKYVCDTIPTIDNRITPEAQAANDAESLARNQAESAEANAEKAKHDGVMRSAMTKAPAGAKAIIVAELDEDTSEMQSDYHAHKTLRRVAIGFRTGAKEDFRQLRAAAAQFPPTAHMGPGCDDWTVLIFTNAEKHGRRPLQHTDGLEAGETISFPNKGTAEAAIEEYATTTPCPFGWDIECRSFEHRENWSMGAGNYLKAGYRDSTGWNVRSYSLPLNHTCLDEDCVPARPTAQGSYQAAAPGSAPVDAGSFTIGEYTHTKHGFQMWVVSPKERLSDERFHALRVIAVALTGWYSRAWSGTPGGFAFKSPEMAQAFAAQAAAN